MTLVYNLEQIYIYFLVQLYKLEIILVAACLLVVEGVDAHVCLLQFLRTIVEWVGGVLLGCHGHYHVGCEDGAVCTFDAFRLYLKYLTHSKLFIGSYFSCHADWRHFLSKGKDRGKW